jgi:hypothetical protein
MASAILESPSTAVKLKSAPDASGEQISDNDDFLPVPARLQDFTTMASSPDESDETAPLSAHVRRSRPLIRNRYRARPRKFELLQQWEGVVTEMDGETFWAELRDLTDNTSNREVVEIYFGEVAEQDKPLIAPGAVFYWSVGYDTSRAGSLVRASEIKFRRTPRWTNRRLEKIRKEAKLMAEKFRNAQQPEQSTTAG